MIRIYYFTRTGDSEKIAKTIAEHVGGTTYQIDDKMNWKGAYNFLKGGAAASSKKTLPAYYEKPEENDTLYLCFPIWAGTFPPAVTTFVSEVGRHRITLVPTSLTSSLKDSEGFIGVIPIIGKVKDVPLEAIESPITP